MAYRKSPSRRRPTYPRQTKNRRLARPWTREEIQFMRKYYRNYETAWIARQLGRTVYSVRYKAVDLHLRKASPKVWKGNVGSPKAFKTNWRQPASRWNKTTRRQPSRRYNARTTRRYQ